MPQPALTSLPALQVDHGDSAIWAQLRAHGAVILKGAARSPDAFEAVTERFAEHFRIHQDPTRERYNAADTMQSVTSGADAIGLHAERAYLPGRPELLFFCCLTPPTSGGATTLCDGAAIVDTLSPEDVRQLDAMTLRWRATMNRPMWQRTWNTEDRAEVLTRFGDALARYGEQARARYWFGETEPDADTLHVDYRTPAISTGRLSGRKAFANYLLLAQDEPDGPSATVAGHGDGDGATERSLSQGDADDRNYDNHSDRDNDDDRDAVAVPGDLLRRVGQAADALTIDIAWEQGDLAIIDNTRCLHGRRAFDGGRRQILVRMGDARFPHS